MFLDLFEPKMAILLQVPSSHCFQSASSIQSLAQRRRMLQAYFHRFHHVPLPVETYSHGLAPSGSIQMFCEAEGFGIAWHGTRHYRDGSRPADSPRHREDFEVYRDEPIEMDLTIAEGEILAGSHHGRKLEKPGGRQCKRSI